MILYINEETGKIEAILKKADPNCPFKETCKELVLPDDFDIYVEYQNEAGEPRKREKTAEELYSSMDYSTWRYTEYPPVTDYIDGVVKGDQEQIQAYIDACLAVKAKYPKPEGNE